MVVELSGRQVFIASPGSLGRERELVRERIGAFNRTHGWPQGVHFIDRGWEQVPGGVGRPQDRINVVLDDCDFMILLIARRWGSSPGGGGGYTSGTEEEFHHARELLGKVDANLRNVLILFHVSASDATETPDEQLQYVIDFRRDIEASKAFLYEIWDTEDSLRNKVDAALAEWSRPLSERQAVSIAWPPAASALVATDGQDPVAQANSLIEQGLRSQAEAVLQKASADGNHSATLAYAKLVRRDGRWDTAMRLNEGIIKNQAILLSEESPSRVLLATALTNLGIIERKLGRIDDSAQHLSEAVATARVALPEATGALAYALDNLGHSQLRRGHAEEAMTAFSEALASRGDGASDDDRLQSGINFARAELQAGNFEAATSAFEALLSQEAAIADRHLLANLSCGLAEARLRRGDADVAALLAQAERVNEDLRNVDGLAIAYGLGVRKALLDTNPEEAEALLRKLESLAGESENLSARGTALVLRGQLSIERGDADTASQLLTEARAVAASASNPLLDLDVRELAEAAGASSPVSGENQA